jgi:hypothetical protein
MASIGRKDKTKLTTISTHERHNTWATQAEASAQAPRRESLVNASDLDDRRINPIDVQPYPPNTPNNPSSSRGASERGICIRNARPSEIANAMEAFEIRARFFYAMGLPRGDQLLTLVQFNVLRALFSNTKALGFGLEWLEPDSQSPFLTNTSRGEYSHSSITAVDLRPSELQRKVIHHPWIDLLPDVTMRDNILRAADAYDEDDLCNDLVDFDGVSHEKTGLIVWDKPWTATGWEVSPAFLHKWPWVVKDCDVLIASTNHWRIIRGEDALLL